MLATQPGMMASPAAVQKYGTQFGRHPVGTGPFKFVDWVPNDRLDLVRNPDYWQAGKPYLAGIEYRFFNDPTVKAVNLVSGAIQTVDYVDPTQVSRVTADKSLVYRQTPGTGVTYIAMNPLQPPLNSQSVRQAIQVAIDRQSIVKNVAFGLGEAARSMVTPAFWAYSDQVPAIPNDPARAKALLGGRNLNLQMKVPPTYIQQAQVVKQNLAQVGINVSVQEEDWGQAISDFYAKNFELELLDDLPAPWPDPDGLLSGFYASNGAFNGTGYNDPQAQGLLRKGLETTDQGARTGAYVELQKYEQQVVLYTPVYVIDNNRAWASTVHGIEMSPDGLLRLMDVWMTS
jgi:peptide/nickel transport system substrate-binding protein